MNGNKQPRTLRRFYIFDSIQFDLPKFCDDFQYTEEFDSKNKHQQASVSDTITSVFILNKSPANLFYGLNFCRSSFEIVMNKAGAKRCQGKQIQSEIDCMRIETNKCEKSKKSWGQRS